MKKQELECEVQSNTRRWDRLFYPALIVFTILFGVGFYSVMQLTADVRRMALSMDTNMIRVADNMDRIANTMDRMNIDTREMNRNLNTIRDEMSYMRTEMHTMNYHVYHMSRNTNKMSSPMKMIMPW